MSSDIPIDPLSSAAEHAELRLPQSGSSLSNRVLERLTRFFLEPQRAYNRGVIDAIRILRQEDQQLAHRITQGNEAAERLTAGLRAALADGQTDAALTRGQVVELARAVQRLESRMAEMAPAPGQGPEPPATPLED